MRKYKKSYDIIFDGIEDTLISTQTDPRLAYCLYKGQPYLDFFSFLEYLPDEFDSECLFKDNYPNSIFYDYDLFISNCETMVEFGLLIRTDKNALSEADILGHPNIYTKNYNIGDCVFSIPDSFTEYIHLNNYLTDSAADFHMPEVPSVDSENKLINKYDVLLKLVITELHKSNFLCLHSAAIKIHKEAYLFSALSGTGKSTFAEIFTKKYPDSSIINDDKPFIKVEDDKATAYHNPWNGKHERGTRETASIKAIFILLRGSQPSITKVSPDEIYDLIYGNLIFNELTESTIANDILLDRLKNIKNIQWYKITITNNESSVEYIYEQLGNMLD